MPQIKDAFSIIETKLPSYPDSVVKISTKIQIKYLIEAENMKESQMAIFLASKMIVSWNFDDENGKPLPINEDNINELPAEDLQHLLDIITPFIQKKTLEKTK